MGIPQKIVTIRKATRDDLPALARIQDSAPQGAHWPVEDYLLYDCTVALSPGGAVIGFLVTREIAGEFEVLNLAVAPASRRQGVARHLLKYKLDEGQNQWFLEVRESNHPAIALYRQLGFHTVGRREAYYREPAESGIVMRF
jgi:[ribosomal protein S18]-alanine N-acetyltransferase